jgi:hypothetical protein
MTEYRVCKRRAMINEIRTEKRRKRNMKEITFSVTKETKELVEKVRRGILEHHSKCDCRKCEKFRKEFSEGGKL